MRCDLRTYRECGCRTGSCQQVAALPAPVFRSAWKDFAMFFGAAAVITVSTFWAVSEAEKQYAKIDRDRQEQIHVVAR